MEELDISKAGGKPVVCALWMAKGAGECNFEALHPVRFVASMRIYRMAPIQQRACLESQKMCHGQCQAKKIFEAKNHMHNHRQALALQAAESLCLECSRATGIRRGSRFRQSWNPILTTFVL